MKIGLPRALVFYYYYPLWERLFTNLGAEVILSDVTSSRLVESGVKVSVPELCVPIKIFNGHILNLLSKNVDYCFVPRFISVDKNEWFCPKFLGLPEIVNYSIYQAKDKMLTFDIVCKSEDTCSVDTYKPLCEIMNVTQKQLKDALNDAKAHWINFRECCKQGYTIDEANLICDNKIVDIPSYESEITIGLLGYVYNIYDKFVSMDIIKKLRQMGVNVITFEMLEENLLNVNDKSKNVYWTFSRKLYTCAKELINTKQVDGILHVTAFGCGPDSVTGKLIELESDKAEMPFMTIRVDEHTGESHILTRLEAFVDMLKRQVLAERRSVYI